MLEKVGFVREGTLREDRMIAGAYLDHWRYGILEREFYARRATG